MSDDQLFRLLIIGGLVPTLAIALPFRIKSQATGEPLDRRKEGLFILSTLRPAAGVMWLAVFAYLIDPSWLAWSSVPVPVWVRWSGIGVWAAAVSLLYWTLSNLGPNLTDTVVTRKAHTLVTFGPYRWIRHPFYGSVTLLIAAVSLMTANWFVLMMGIAVITLLVVRTSREEELLIARFGDSYRGYMSRTGRFLPRLY